ncbi:MAG TPA: prolyl oligopeptidase family serine peptidase [Rudaea sp.]|nr:prolyl oligopeptidase family serine peptidase [Rudaea sp.]
MSRLLAGALGLVVFASAPAQQAPLTLEQIMADPDWIAGQIEVPEPFDDRGVPPYFGVDGRSVYYRVKRSGSPIRDLHRIDLADGSDSAVDAAAMANADGAQTVFDASRHYAAFVRNGDVFLRELATARLIQITRTAQDETAPQFSPDGRKLSFRAGQDWFVYDIAAGVATPAAVLKAEKDPDAPPAKADDLRDLQLRLFSTLKQNNDDKRATREHAEQMQKGDPTRAPVPFYLGDEVRIVGTALAPDTRHLFVVTVAKSHDEGKKGKLTRYVTESGYEEFEDERTRVGRNDMAPQTLWLFDLAAHTKAQIDADGLPGIHDDPLKSVREENAAHGGGRNTGGTDVNGRKEKSDGKPKDEAKARTLEIAAMHFSEDGANTAVELRALDNKDRWIARVDFASHTLVPEHRLHDDAWINWTFNDFGFTRDGRTLWYLSEESGYSHLYAKPLDGKARALTQGQFEISDPQLSHDGRWFYVRANATAPRSYDVYRVAVGGGELQRVTHDGGVGGFSLSPDDRQLLVAHSSSYVPPQIAIVAADGSGAQRELTDTRTPQYKALSWVAPQFVQVPSKHFKGSIWAKFYAPDSIRERGRAQHDDHSSSPAGAAGQEAGATGAQKHPAVIFVHGAGYTQNVHEQWPYYFREQMFHNLLLQKGYVVLDMDYRASEGYGREWRTAIYRQMGHPELEDLLDGKQWLVDNYDVDPKRVGIYGGSYGGFMTLMALFRAPGEFAAGAALRPVADWTQYNQEYTSNILNDPQIDPIAYARSSPIEFADGLRDPLLICHGVIDDNVLFEDSMRLYQRLIELHKDNFTLSPYPLDRHGFTNADSWLDEYKRIYRLFETNLK